MAEKVTLRVVWAWLVKDLEMVVYVVPHRTDPFTASALLKVALGSNRRLWNPPSYSKGSAPQTASAPDKVIMCLSAYSIFRLGPLTSSTEPKWP